MPSPLSFSPLNKLKRFKSLKLCISKSLLNSPSLYDAVSSLDHFHPKGIRLPSRVLAILLRHCSASKSYREGKLVHLHLKLTGFKRPTTYLANHLISMYFSCGDFVSARKVFDKMEARNLYSWNNMISGYVKLGMMKQARGVFDRMPERDFVSWNTMIVGYAQNRVFGEALRFYGELRRLCIGYNGFSFASVLIVCVKLKDFELSRQVHGQVLVLGFLTNVVVSSSVVDAYAKCGKMKEAGRLFDEIPVRDIPAWTTLISGYAACGNMESAAEVFYQMPQKNSYSWTSLIGGYARNGMGHEALRVFRKMIQHRVRPDKYTFHSCFLACAIIASLKHGKQLHSYLVQNNIRPNTVVVGAIIDMYSKCGSLETAKKVFNLNGNKQDVVLWNSMISALTYCGYGTEAIIMLNNMLRSGVKPDKATFVSILNACSHLGLVQEGLQFFMSMTSEHGVVPDQEHYACLVSLLHRAGCFNESGNDLQVMDHKPGEHVENCLLGLWRKLESAKLEREIHKFPVRLQLQSSAAYLLLSSVYVALVKRGSVEKMRQIMHEQCLRLNQAVT